MEAVWACKLCGDGGIEQHPPLRCRNCGSFEIDSEYRRHEDDEKRIRDIKRIAARRKKNN